MLDPDPDSMNPDPQHCHKPLRSFNSTHHTFYQYKFYRIFGMPTALHGSTAGSPGGIPAQ